ncbi:MAG: acyl-protein synthetase [Polyangiales bacterium]
MRDTLHQRIQAAMTSAPDEDVVDALFADLRAYQRERIAPYERMLAARSHPAGLPTDVFRFARIAAFPEAESTRTFRTSGTTHGARGEHHYKDLTLYDRGAQIAARRMLFPDVDKMRLILLVAPEDQVPDSSLGYMLARFTEWFASSHEYVWPANAAALSTALAKSQEPVALLGTSFAFVHVCDEATRRWALPPGSRIMQTGGFKGRSRTLDASAMRALLSETFGIPESHIVSEYGMTELSSQMYETSLVDALAGSARERHYWAPWWMRVTPVDAATLLPSVSAGDVGILRLEDAANLDSVACLQTADRGRLVPGGFQLLGRDPNAVPRGCSLAAEEALT